MDGMIQFVRRYALLIIMLTGLPGQQSMAQTADVAVYPIHEQHAEDIARSRHLIDSLMEAQNIPGLQIAVSVDEEPVWSGGFGYADLEHKVPVWPVTKMRIGSVSKTLTSAAVGKLFEAGKLDLDKPVQAYVPSFPKKRYEITTRQVAGHLAGIRHYRGDEFLSDKFYATVEEGLEIFKDDTLLFKPGTEYSYSSYGWNLVSAVVEGASDIDFLAYMKQEVFEPLNMEHTVAEMPDRIIYHRTSYYSKNDNGEIVNAPFVDNSYKWAGGGFIGTAEDLLLFGNAMLDDEFLKRDTIAMLWESMETSDGKNTNYGIGWGSGTDSAGRKWYGHSGGSVGGTTQFVVFPEEEVVIAVISNLGNVDYDDIHIRIAGLFMTEE